MCGVLMIRFAVIVVRFFFFARSARKFLDLAKQLGVGPARQVANEARHPKRAAKSKQKIKSQKKEEPTASPQATAT